MTATLMNQLRAPLSWMTCLLLLPGTAGAVGSWSPVTHAAPGGVGLMLMMPDGTVLAASRVPDPLENPPSSGSRQWYRLKPDSLGSFVNGTWSVNASMRDTRLWFSSQVLQNGKVFVAGGEYGTGGNSAELYDPVADSWSVINVPSGLICNNCSTDAENSGFRDSGSRMLPNGEVMIAPVFPANPNATVIYDPVANSLSQGPTYQASQNESTWVLLPDTSILSVDKSSTSSERFIPSLNSWIPDASAPVSLYDPFGAEEGPGFLLPNGKVIFFGGNGNTAIYTPSGGTNAGSWVQGPSIPNGLAMPDAGACMMVNGKILLAAALAPYSSTNVFTPPTYFFEYDYSSGTTGSFTQVASPTGGLSDNIGSYQAVMLALPDGNVLYSDFGSTVYVYTPDSAPLAAGQPVIKMISSNGDGSFTLNGTGLNGISSGAAYGEDAQMDSNYPLVRFTDGSGNVYYGRTTNWSSTAVMTGTNVLSTRFILPPGLPAGSYLTVVANGIASAPVAFWPSDHPTVNFVYPTNNELLSVSSAPQILGYADDTNATLLAVRVALSRNSDGVWYDFVSGAWGTTTFDFNRNVLNASYVSGNHTGWSAQLPLLPAGNYTVQAQSVNLFNNASDWKSVPFVVETAPVVAFSPLTNSETVFDLVANRRHDQ